MRDRRSVVHAVLALWLVAGLSFVPALDAQEATAGGSEMEVLEEREGDGEQCIVCRQAIDGDMIVEVRYKGRTFHVAKKMLATFEADPEAYFRSLQARGGLFDEEAMPTRQVGRPGWLIFGLYVLAGLVFGALSSYMAIGRARRPWRWFAAGFLLNVVGVIWLLVLPRGTASQGPEGVPRGLSKVPVTRRPSSCPRCGSAHHPSASQCAVCGVTLDPSIEPETARA